MQQGVTHHSAPSLSALSASAKSIPVVKTLASPANAIPETESTEELSPPDRRPGKGGEQHKQLQHLIKSLGEARGFKATIEKQVLGGASSIDVVLERDDVTIAFEVSISTGVAYEIHNIHKCIEAGVSGVIVVAPGQSHLRSIQDAIEKLEMPHLVSCVTPERLPAVLDALGSSSAPDAKVRGWVVRIDTQVSRTESRESSRRAIAHTIKTALRRLSREGRGRRQPGAAADPADT